MTVILIGSTGNGKSSTGNTLMGYPGAFEVGYEALSHTKHVKRNYNASQGLYVVDTPGFGDHRVQEANISENLSNFSRDTLRYSPEFAVIANAFLLVQKASPRLSTLKMDILHMIAIFGTIALKSTIILIIQPSDKKSEKVFEEAFKEMEAINQLYSSVNAKTHFILWDNLNVKSEDFDRLKEMVKVVPSYTYETFAQAQKDIKTKSDDLIHEMFENKRRIMEEEAAKDQNEANKEIARLSALLSYQATASEELLILYNQKKNEANGIEEQREANKNDIDSQITIQKLRLNEQMQQFLNKTLIEMRDAQKKIAQSNEDGKDQLLAENIKNQNQIIIVLDQKLNEENELKSQLDQINARQKPNKCSII